MERDVRRMDMEGRKEGRKTRGARRGSVVATTRCRGNARCVWMQRSVERRASNHPRRV